MTRIAILDRKNMNAEQGKVYDDVKAEGGPLGGPYWAYIRFPKLMRMLQDVSNLLGGVALELDSSVAVGDWVRIDDVAGFDLHPGLRGSWGDLITHLKSTLA